MPGHGLVIAFALEAIANNELVALAPFIDEARDLGKVMAAVGVAHDDELAACLFDPVTEGASVAFELGVYHSRAMLPGNLNRAVGRAVIRNYDFSANAYVAEGVQGFVYARCNGLHFVESGNDDRYLDRRLPGPSQSTGGEPTFSATVMLGT